MKKFTCVQDIGDLREAVAEALEIKRDRFQFTGLGRNRTLLMLFFNSSLRTRLSTQKAAMNLGMNVMVLDVTQGAWKLETERGVVMDGDKAEHLLEAIPVMGSYCDVIGVRSFATRPRTTRSAYSNSSSATRAVRSSRWRPPHVTRCRASPI